ncbi:MAG: glycoside hydrolase family 172 protein [Bacteroidota bacterium]
MSLFFVVTAHAQNTLVQKTDTITLGKILSALYDVSQLPGYLEKTYSAQVSSYDITGGNDDGFSGKNSFIRRNADSSLVIFDVKGCGVINRIWTPTPTEDTLDFYLDGKAKPALSVKYSDLFSGKMYPFVAPLCGNDLGGFYCYFPILFNNGCIIVSRGKKMQFHQVQYRLYSQGSIAEDFSSNLSAIEKKALETIGYLWGKANRRAADFMVTVNTKPLKRISKQFDLVPGQSTVIFNALQGGRIAGIECSPATAFEGLNKLIDIEIIWDDDKTPAVFCPLADFFGYAFGKHAMEALLLGTRRDTNYCYIPMPFDKRATIRLRYRKAPAGITAAVIHINTSIFYSDEKRLSGKEGRFYTSWNRIAVDGQPHTFLNTNGRGHYIGTVLQAQGLNPGMTYFFEGDDSTVVDGTMRLHGTGSEDYFNGGWYALSDRWAGKLSLPLHGCLDYSLPYSHTGAYRFYLSDKISFEKNIFHSIEHGPSGNHVPVDYTSLGFYYCDTAPDMATTPVNDLTKMYVPDTLIMYPQLMNTTIENEISVKTTWSYGTGGLSYIYTAGNESGLKISVTEIPLGKYKLLMDFVRNGEGAEFSFWQGQHNISGWLTANAPAEIIEKNYTIASIENTESKNALTIHFKTSPGKDKLILNRLIFINQKP